MAWTKFLRIVVSALFVAGQTSALTLVGAAQAASAPCPAHAAAASAPTNDPVPHQGHMAVGDQAHHERGDPVGSKDAAPDPSAFAFACCSAHLVGLAAPLPPLVGLNWVNLPMNAGQAAPLPSDLSSVDPPPRLLL